MERRHFLKLALSVAAGTVALAAAGAEAAPLSPQPLARDERLPPANEDVHPAVITGDEVDRLKPELVHWHGHRRHWGWRHRHWGWRRRHWHRRYW